MYSIEKEIKKLEQARDKMNHDIFKRRNILRRAKEKREYKNLSSHSKSIIRKYCKPGTIEYILLMNKSRLKPIVKIRKSICIEMRQSGYGLKMIGDIFGYSHGAIIYLLKDER